MKSYARLPNGGSFASFPVATWRLGYRKPVLPAGCAPSGAPGAPGRAGRGGGGRGASSARDPAGRESKESPGRGIKGMVKPTWLCSRG